MACEGGERSARQMRDSLFLSSPLSRGRHQEQARTTAELSKQAELLRGAPRRIEMARREPGAGLVEAELRAGELEAPADHPGDRAAAGHALAEARVVILAAAGLADELE